MAKQAELAIRENEAPVVPSSGNALTPMEMLDRAVTGGASPDTLEKLMALQERWEKNQARKAFDNAMALAKAEIPIIVKNRTVGFESKRTNERTSYKHEDMAAIARTVDPILTKHGLSYRYRTNVAEGGLIEVTCIIAHRDGHSEETTLRAGRDESGSKNNIQAVGSAITYLQRYTLKAALGLAASDDDDAASVGSGPTGPITDGQAAHLNSICDEIGADKRAFCEYFGIEGIPMLPAKQYDTAIRMLEQKRAKASKAKAKAEPQAEESPLG